VAFSSGKAEILERRVFQYKTSRQNILIKANVSNHTDIRAIYDFIIRHIFEYCGVIGPAYSKNINRRDSHDNHIRSASNHIRDDPIEMDDPLLSSLCSICRINIPKYTCPRCSVQTCSLPCSRRHKLWSSCSGIRDPTVYKPMSQLATPSGVDHDYNFLHSIEYQIERSEKRIVEDRGLVGKEELAAARRDEDPGEWRVKMRKRKRQNPGQEPIERALKAMRTTVELAPKGMKRSLDNGTTWARNKKCINWQVEWVREGNAGRSLSKVMGNKPIGEAYSEFLEEERKNSLTDEEKRLERKQRERQAKEERARLAKQQNQMENLASRHYRFCRIHRQEHGALRPYQKQG